jgi:phosphate starvation-inducible PhoH-like protein
MRKNTRTKQQIVENYTQPKEVDEIHKKQKKLVGTSKLTKIKLKEKQRELIQVIDDNDLIIILGPSGVSKTFMDCYYAIEALAQHKFEKVIFTKPIKEAGEKLGALPGDVNDKIDPYYESFRQNLLQIVDKPTLEKLMKSEVIEFKPLTYLRGCGFQKTLLVLDESQNCDITDIMLFVTRMGEGSKVLISGDMSQHDIHINESALMFFSKMVEDIDNICTFKFERQDIMRHKILIEITDRYEKLKYSDNLPRAKNSR